MKARDKLEEAKYFLGMMKTNISDRSKFRYNLSASLSAARSVTFYLQSEYRGRPEFDRWYESKQEEMKKDDIMSFFKDRRNYVLKEGQIDLRGRFSVSLVEHVTVSSSVSVTVKRANGTTETVRPIPSPVEGKKDSMEPRVTVAWFFEEIPDEGVVTLCERYVQKLSLLLEDAEKTIKR